MDTNRIFGGVDLAAGKRKLTVALLSGRLDVRSVKDRTPAEAAEELASFGEITVAVGGPLRGRRSEAAGADALGETLRSGKVRRARAAETELARRGIPVRRTPALESAAPAWMRAGFRLAAELARRGFAAGGQEREPPRAVLETHPTACAAVLLGRLPFGRETLEGRIQRQLALLREKVALPDPMEALEEITAHHLLSGRLSLEGVCRAEELDALLAAYAAWRSWSSPESAVWLGDEADGWICLPAKGLLEKYSK
jgi:hypothetical protein